MKNIFIINNERYILFIEKWKMNVTLFINKFGDWNFLVGKKLVKKRIKYSFYGKVKNEEKMFMKIIIVIICNKIYYS